MNVCREICFQSRKSVTSKRFLFILTLENEEAEKILLKTMFRRSKAFMELGHHQRALNDISFCLRTQVNNTGNANNVLSIFWEVRNKPDL